VKLTPIEAQSAAWLRLRDYMNERLHALRCQNDGDLTMEQTIKLRGRAAQLKELLALGQPGPEQAEADD
jgi:hypothetical protein